MSVNVNAFRRLLLPAVLISWLSHIVLIWMFRFVPSNDYPEWLLQAHVLANYANPAFDYNRWYALLTTPIPNGGFVIPTAMLSMIVPIETAGKLILTSYLLWLPLAIRSFYKSQEQKSGLWVVAVAMLFNILFFNGNMGFLIGVCLLFTSLAYVESRRTRFSTKDSWITALLSALLLLAHAVCFAVFALYCVLLLFNKRTDARVRRASVVSMGIGAALSAFYAVGVSGQAVLSRIEWRVDFRYRLALITKPFFVGWAYPPFEFSMLRFVVTVCFVLIGIFLIAFAIKPLLKKFNETAVARLAVLLTLFTFLGPKHFLGIAELSHRFAIIWLSLVAVFTVVPGKLLRVVQVAVTMLLCFVAFVRLQDYSASSTVIQKRHEFLVNYIPPGNPILTLDDRLGAPRARDLHLVPKGVSFTFQTNYLLFAGGYNPLSFRTFVLSPKDSLLFTPYDLSRNNTSDSLPGVEASQISSAVKYIVIDAEGTKGKEFAARLSEHFELVAESTVTGEIRTTVLRRVH